MDLNDRTETLEGVGRKRTALYNKIGIYTVGDLIYHFPRSYIDFCDVKPLREIPLFDEATVKAKLKTVEAPRRIGGGRTLYKATVADPNGDVMEVLFFNNPYVLRGLKIGEYYLFHGKMDGNILIKKLINPKVISESDRGFEGVYKLTAGLSSNMIRTNVLKAISCVETQETLPENIIKKHRLISLRDALYKIHFPKKEEDIENSRRRIAFEELLIWQLGLCLLKKGVDRRTNIRLKTTDLSCFTEELPFEFTSGQKKALEEIIQDCTNTKPANRLLQGDVGSGKTAVAAAVLYLFAKSGYQGAMMAPTDLLARQHFDTINEICAKFGITTSLLVGSMTAKEKETERAKIKNGESQIVIGTHTLFQDKTEFNALGIVVTDEQHRFGVSQRQKLTQKGDNPHTLVMSATPIPRSLALIMYGDLDVSTIDVLPAGRKKVDTFVISGKKRADALRFIKKQIDLKDRAYIICPAVEENEGGAQSVESYAHRLMETVFKGYEVGILHGKLKKEQKEAAMENFVRGKTPVLVATTVVEVGIDVKEATVILIENAELFGLSQLHQLRGRVGRGDKKSYCILVSSLRTKENYSRLSAMRKTNDGFEIAKEDLKVRGPGDFFGDRQHGLPQFKIADIFADMKLLKECRDEALEIIKAKKYKEPEYFTVYNKAVEMCDKDTL